MNKNTPPKAEENTRTGNKTPALFLCIAEKMRNFAEANKTQQ